MVCLLWIVITSCITCSAQLFISPASQWTLNNEVALITCSCNSTTLPCTTFTWIKNGKKITNERLKVTNHHDNHLSLLRIQPVKWKTDEGMYTCVMDEFASKLNIFNLRAEAPPGFPQLLENTPTMEVTSEGAILSCPAIGEPTPTITWYKNLLPLSPLDASEVLFNGSLIIKKMPEEGSDNYECRVSNERGSLHSSPISINTSVGTPVNLSLTLVDGAAHVTWNVVEYLRSVSHYKLEYGIDGEASHVQEILTGTTTQFTSAILDRGTEYEFLVSSKTALGWSDKAVSRIKTTDGVPLGSPLNISGSEITESFKLNWVPPLMKHRMGKIVVYEIRERADDKMEDWTVNTTESFYIIGDLRPQQSYSFQIRAYTSAGPGPWSSYVQIFTKPESTLQPPRGIKLSRISPFELEVSWQHVTSNEPITYEVFSTIHATSDLTESQHRIRSPSRRLTPVVTL